MNILVKKSIAFTIDIDGNVIQLSEKQAEDLLKQLKELLPVTYKSDQPFDVNKFIEDWKKAEEPRELQPGQWPTQFPHSPVWMNQPWSNSK